MRKVIKISRNHLLNQGNIIATIKEFGFYGRPKQIANIESNLISTDHLAKLISMQYPDYEIEIDDDRIDYIDEKEEQE